MSYETLLRLSPPGENDLVVENVGEMAVCIAQGEVSLRLEGKVETLWAINALKTAATLHGWV